MVDMKKVLGAILIVVSTHQVSAQQNRNDNPEFFLSTQKKKLAVILAASQFKPGDRIVDIGAGLGWFDAAIGIHTDSLSFYLEEIDSSYIKNERLNEALAVYEKVKGAPITCSYKWAIGEEKSTNLPEISFDKILLIDTYHHIEHRDEMIRNMASILKPGGKLIVMEPIARKRGDIYKGCYSVVFTPSEIISSFIEKGFMHERTLKTVKSTRKRVRVFVFSKP